MAISKKCVEEIGFDNGFEDIASRFEKSAKSAWGRPALFDPPPLVSTMRDWPKADSRK